MIDTMDISLTRGRGSYAQPEDTIALRDTPINLKQIQRLTRWYYLRDGLLHAIIDKMAEYPVTDIVVKARAGETLQDDTRERWNYLLNVVLDLRRIFVQINVDKKVFGQSFYYLYYPFVRYCVCPDCKNRYPIAAFKHLRAVPRDAAAGFILSIEAPCPGCNNKTRLFKTEDRKSESRTGLHFTRLDPLRMELEYNPISGAKRWYWTPPKRLKQGLMDGDRTIIDSTEIKVLEACFKDQKILMNKDRLFVAQADGVPGLWEGWAMPPLFPVLESVYYYKVLLRANEALAHEHVNPLRIVSPVGTGDISPQRTMSLTDWQAKIKNELYKFKRDPNHILVSPMPISVEQIGGQARVMMVSSEIEAAARVIAASLGCPIELIWGGLNWSGASVSLRVLENHFLNEREDDERLLNYLIPKLATYFRLPRVKATLTDFKMADDAAKQANMINLMIQGFLSREGVLPELGCDPKQEFGRLKVEHASLNDITMQDNIEASHMNTIIQALEAKAGILLQMELSALQQSVGAQSERERLAQLSAHVQQLHEQGYTAAVEFDQSATILSRLQPNVQQLILSKWQQTMPSVTALLLERINQVQAQQQSSQLAMRAMGGPEGAQSNGAAEGNTLQPGAQGPYGQDGNGSSLADPGAALPEQRPPNKPRSSKV